MKNQAVTIVLNDLSTDFVLFVTYALPVFILFSLWIAGAKLLEIKGQNRWPALFAITPMFWIIVWWLDPRSSKSKQVTQRLSLAFGLVSLALTVFIFRFY